MYVFLGNIPTINFNFSQYVALGGRTTGIVNSVSGCHSFTIIR